MVNFALLTFYDYYFVASTVGNKPDVRPVPRWVWLMAAVNLFLSHTLGKAHAAGRYRCAAQQTESGRLHKRRTWFGPDDGIGATAFVCFGNVV